MINIEYAIKRIDNFIRQLEDEHEIQISKEGAMIKYGIDRSPSYSTEIQMKQTGTLADHLSKFLTQYEMDKIHNQTNIKNVEGCLFWINQAYATHSVIDGESSIKKLKEYQDKIASLEKELDVSKSVIEKLRTDRDSYKAKFELYDQHFKGMYGSGQTQVGDVEDGKSG